MTLDLVVINGGIDYYSPSYNLTIVFVFSCQIKR